MNRRPAGDGRPGIFPDASGRPAAPRKSDGPPSSNAFLRSRSFSDPVRAVWRNSRLESEDIPFSLKSFCPGIARRFFPAPGLLRNP